MKCVKHGATIERVSNEKAKELVDSGKAEYTPKHVWKKNVRDK